MSQEDVKIVRRAWEAAWSKPPNWALLSVLYHQDHVFESDCGGVNNTVYRGAAGFQGFRADQDERGTTGGTISSVSSTRAVTRCS
jgi:hypothetical protein